MTGDREREAEEGTIVRGVLAGTDLCDILGDGVVERYPDEMGLCGTVTPERDMVIADVAVGVNCCGSRPWGVFKVSWLR